MGRTVGTGSWDEPDGIRKPVGGTGMRGPPAPGCSMGGGVEASPMREDRRLIGTPVSERSAVTMRRSWSAACRHTAQHTRCLS